MISRFLASLRFLERVVGLLEVGAAVLLVGVEEQLVEPVIQIVVVSDVAAGAPRIVAADDAAREEAIATEEARRERALLILGVAQHKLEELVDGAALDDEATVHEQLADAQLGVENGGALGAGVHEADADFFAATVAEGVHAAAGSHDRQRSALHQPRQDCCQNTFHGTTTGKPPSVLPRRRQAQARGVKQRR